jgi:hypothetical protein
VADTVLYDYGPRDEVAIAKYWTDYWAREPMLWYMADILWRDIQDGNAEYPTLAHIWVGYRRAVPDA